MWASFLLLTVLSGLAAAHSTGLHVVSFRGESDDAVTRFVRSLEVFGYQKTIIDISSYGRVAGDVLQSKKLEKLRHSIETIKTEYVLVLDSHSSLVLSNPSDVIQKTETLAAEFVFAQDENSTENSPNANALFQGMMAKTPQLKKLVDILSADTVEDFDLNFHTALSKVSTNVKVDTGAVLFQQIHQNTDTELKIRYEGDRGYVQNVNKDSVPPILIAAQNGKRKLNSLSNYLVRVWSPETGCQICDEEKIDLKSLKKENYPNVQLTVFVSEPTPFLEVFFERLANLTYPKSRIDLVTYCNVEKQKAIVESYISKYSGEYRVIKEIKPTSEETETVPFQKALSLCLETEERCDNLFYLEPTSQLRKTDTLEHLISIKKNVVTPMMTRPGKFWSSFWGAVSEDGSYARSDDYFDIVERRQTGLWNVPFVGNAILFSRWAVGQIEGAIKESPFILPGISTAALERNVFLFVDNREEFGHLVNPETYNFEHLHNDLWQIFDNPTDWEERYIHPGYYHFANKSTTMADFEQPCPDVFWVPLMSETFCKQLIEEMEHSNSWSEGKHDDSRLEGGYENVPTVDIHMRQVNWEEHWMQVLQKYVHPLQLKLWEGYYDKPTARMNFVVRYKQGEQPSLRLHHDASTYTLDMALNRAHIDYTGGGVRYPRYNCTLVDTRVGWPLIFPGRLTHLHEGLETTSGTRYIFVTFINP